MCTSPGVLGKSLAWKKPNTPCPAAPNNALEPTPNSLRSVRRVSGMEECGNALGVQALNEPLGLSVIDHSMT